MSGALLSLVMSWAMAQDITSVADLDAARAKAKERARPLCVFILGGTWSDRSRTIENRFIAGAEFKRWAQEMGDWVVVRVPDARSLNSAPAALSLLTVDDTKLVPAVALYGRGGDFLAMDHVGKMENDLRFVAWVNKVVGAR
ncbi:MAG: thioredoxin family protein [Planctomycetes bacterium]|nr:thioredoxin family protein [Planctomycetota bacterium]